MKRTVFTKSLSVFLAALMVFTLFGGSMTALAAIGGVPTRNDVDSYFSDPTLYGAEKWNKTADLATLTFNWNAYSGSIGYDPQPGKLTFTYPSHVYLNVGETLEGAGYMGHMTASYGENDGSDVTDFRVLLSSATWGESTRAGFGDVIGSLISGYGHQGTCTEGSKQMTGSSSHYDFANDGRGSDQILGNKSSDNENFLEDNESIVVWRSNIQWTGSDMNNFDEYVLLKGTAAKAGEVTFNPTENFTIGAAQRYTSFAWHTDNGARLNRSLFGNSSRPEAAPAEDALSITFTVYDKSGLNTLISAADNGNYTLQEGQTQEQFAAALTAAKAVRANREVTQDEIDAAAAAIGDKMTLLVNANEPNYTSAAADSGLATGDGSANSFNAVAYHCADPATGDINGDAYRNLAYAPYNDTYWSAEAENNNTFYTVALPSAVVMVYDGVSGHEPMSPVVLQHKGDRSMDYMYSKNEVLYFDHDWIGYTDENYNDWQGYQLWPDVPQHWNEQNPTNGSQYLIDYAYRDRNSMYRHINGGKQNPGTSTRRSFCNAYVYHGTGDTTNFFEKYSDAQLSIGYSHTWYNWAGSADPITAEVWPSGTIYVVNYQPIYSKLADAAAVKAIIEGDTAWQYTEASVRRAKGTIMAMIAANPNNFTYEGNVAQGVADCAAAIKDAKYMLDNGGLTLEKKQGTVTFVDQLGNTVAINGQPATYTKNYGETIAANEIPQLSNVYYRVDNAQWDYGETLSWDPVLPGTIIFDEPEKVFAVSDEQTVQTYTVNFYDEDGETVLATADWQYGDYPDYGGTIIKQNGETATVVAPTKQDYDFNYEFTAWKDGEDNKFTGLNAMLNQLVAEGTDYNSRAYLEGDKFTKYVADYDKTARTDADYTAYDAALAAANAVLDIPGLASAKATEIQGKIDAEIARAHDDQSRNFRSDDKTGVNAIATAVAKLNDIVADYTDGEGNLKDEYIGKYPVTVSAGENTTLTVKNGDALVNSGDEVAYGTVLTIEAVPAELYSQNDVTVKVNGAVYADLTYTVTAATAISTDAISAENINKYAVTVTAGDNTTLTVKNGDAVVNSGDEVAYGTVLTIEAAPTEAYSQNDVTVKVNGEAFTGSTVTVTAATAIATDAIDAANINTYTVTWKNGETVVGTAPVKYGSDVAAEKIPTIPAELPAYDAANHFTYAWAEVDLTNVTEDKTVWLVTTVTAHDLGAAWQWADDASSATLTLSCACGYTETHTEDVTISPKSHTDATCDNKETTVYTAVYGAYTAPDKTVEGAFGNHDYSGEPVLTRPVYDADTDTWSGGVYKWYCQTNAAHPNITLNVERADYSAFDEAVAKLEEVMTLDLDPAVEIPTEDEFGQPTTVTLGEVLEEIEEILGFIDDFGKDLVVTPGNDPDDPLNEQPYVDGFVAELQEVLAIFFNDSGTVKEELLSRYTVTFTLRDGSETKYENKLKGDVVDVPAAPATADGFTFEGWALEGSAAIDLSKDAATYTVAGNAAFTAAYSDAPINYVITWIVDGAESTTTVEHGQTPVFSGSTDKADDDLYAYAFTGWEPAIVAAEAPAAYTAQYDKAFNDAVQNKIDEAQDLIDNHADEYDDDLIADLQEALDVLADDTKTDDEKKAALDDLNDLIDNKDDSRLTVADTAALEALIAAKQSILDEENAAQKYTADTISGLTDAIAAAQAVVGQYKGISIKTSELEAANAAIENAVNALNAVTVTVADYMVTWNVGGEETTESYPFGETPTFKGSTDQADDDLYANTFTGWAPAIAAVTADATYTAQYDKSYSDAVQDKIDEAQEIIDDHADEYDDDFIDDLKDALDVLADDTKTDDEKKAALDDLKDLLDNKNDSKLVPVDTAALADAIAAAEAVVNDPDAAALFTPEALAGLADAIAAAQDYLDETAGTSVPADELDARQQEIADKAAALNDAVNGLEKNPADYTEYNALRDKLETLKDNDALTDELKAAVNEHYNNPLPDDLKIDQQQTIDDEVAAIKAVLDQILEKDGDDYTDTVKDDALAHFTVTFQWKTDDGEQTAAQTVVKHADAAAPEIPACYHTDSAASHFLFSKWDKAFTDVTADLTVNAKYTAQAHTGSWTVVTAPTEEAEGVASMTCSACGGTFTKAIPAFDAGSSQYRGTVTKAATCHEEGVMTYTWVGSSDVTFTRPIPKTAHQWGEWVITVPATDETDGEAERTCRICGEKEYDTAANVAEGTVTYVRFRNIGKMHYLVQLPEGETYAVFNSSTVQWTSNRAMKFTVCVYSTFNYPDIIIYADGKEITPDENGVYTVPATGGTVTITAAGAVQDDSAPNGKLSFWELLIRFFQKIIAVFTGRKNG